MLYHMNCYNTHSAFFVSCYTSNVEQYQKIDKFLNLLSSSGACKLIENEIKNLKIHTNIQNKKAVKSLIFN